ncbi:MAG: hypothetical protein SGPRY_006162 [Prymnesium sp.]
MSFIVLRRAKDIQESLDLMKEASGSSKMHERITLLPLHSEDLLNRPGRFWVAQAGDVKEVRQIATRSTIGGVAFSPGDDLVWISRYFDRAACDTSVLTFDEWLPELVFSPADKDATLTITSSGHIKVGREARSQVMWGEQQPPLNTNAVVYSQWNDEWVKYGHRMLDKFPNPRVASDF